MEDQLPTYVRKAWTPELTVVCPCCSHRFVKAMIEQELKCPRCNATLVVEFDRGFTVFIVKAHGQRCKCRRK